MTEREKQAAGLPFDGDCDELKNLHFRAQGLIRKLNEMPVDDDNARFEIIKKLFGRAGKNLRVYLPLRVDFGCNIYTGDNVLINQNCTLLDTGKIVIGERVLIAPDVKIYTATHPLNANERYYAADDGEFRIKDMAKPVQIGNDVWVGGGSIILPGVTIGNNVIVGAGSVVKKNIPDNVIVAGNPAKIIKENKN